MVSQSRPLTHILHTNKKTLHQDLIQFAQLDEALHLPVTLGSEEFAVDFVGGGVKDNELVFEADITFPNKKRERLPLIKAKTSEDEVKFTFSQDVDLEGNPKTYTYKPSKEEVKEYNSFRNSLFSQVHNLILNEYSGTKSSGLIRKRFKK